LTTDVTCGEILRVTLKTRLIARDKLSHCWNQMLCEWPESVPWHGSLDKIMLAHVVADHCKRTSMPAIPPTILPILMLFASNVFMTFAWYGHLKFKESPLPVVILVSWGIAFFEYWLAVPANRWGSAVYSAAQLKTMQEVITLVVFAGFSVLYLKEPLGWNHALGFALIAGGAFLIFHRFT
jgi:uncharacterized protein